MKKQIAFKEHKLRRFQIPVHILGEKIQSDYLFRCLKISPNIKIIDKHAKWALFYSLQCAVYF